MPAFVAINPALGMLRRPCFEDRIGSASELFRHNHDRKHDVLARNFCEIFQQERVIFEVITQNVGVSDKAHTSPT
jgi:hypothetical protein